MAGEVNLAGPGAGPRQRCQQLSWCLVHVLGELRHCIQRDVRSGDFDLRYVLLGYPGGGCEGSLRQPCHLPCGSQIGCKHLAQRTWDSPSSTRRLTFWRRPGHFRFNERPALCATCVCVIPAFSRASHRLSLNTAAADGSTLRVPGVFRGVVVIAIRSRSVGQAPRNILAVL